MSPLFVQLAQIVNKRDHLEQILSQPCAWGRDDRACPLKSFRKYPELAKHMSETDLVRLLKTHLEHDL